MSDETKVVEGATGAREWLETFLGKVPPYKFLSTVNESGRAALANVLAAYASSQLKKLDGVAKDAAEKIANEWAKNTTMVRGFLGTPAPNSVAMQELSNTAAAIISQLIAERLSK